MPRVLRPLRTIAALVTLSAFLTGGVWAYVCPPDMDMDGMATTAEQGEHAMPMDMAHSPVGAGDSPVGAGDSPEQPSSNTPPTPCPLAVLGQGSSCIASSLPASVGFQIEPSFLDGGTLSITPDAGYDLLLAYAFFHPPRA